MEKRFILFILICLVAFPLYYKLVLPEPEPAPVDVPTAAERPVPPPSARGNDGGDGGAGAAPSPVASAGPELPDHPAEIVILENDVLRLELRAEGAGIHAAHLLAYRDEGSDPPLPVASPELRSGVGLVVRIHGIGDPIPLESVRWELLERSASRAVFRYPLPGGGSVTKAIELPAEGHEVALEVTIEGEPSAARDATVQVLGPERIRYEPRSVHENQRVAGLLDPRGRFAETDHEQVGPLPQRVRVDERPIAWAGLESNYFAWVIRPLRGERELPPRLVEIGDPDKSRAAEYEGAHDLGRQEYPYRVGFQRAIVPGRTDRYRVFIGPKERAVLAAYEEHGYAELIDYGSLGWLVRTFLFLLRTFESVTGSWGMAIILLTALVRTVLHPVNKRNQRSMQRQQKKMAKIQPEMKALREKHKNEPLKANQEIQKLFREHGVNPAQMFGGCLMIFLQLPIWIGLINTFRLAIELRQASFLWIADLTAPDHLLELPFRLPLFGWGWLNLLPVIYVIVTLINQRMMPRSDDPQMRQQQKMMTIMMVAFGFIFYEFASGLMVYFITSATLGILEQHIIRAELRHEEGNAGNAAALPAPTPTPALGKVKRRT